MPLDEFFAVIKEANAIESARKAQIEKLRNGK